MAKQLNGKRPVSPPAEQALSSAATKGNWKAGEHQLKAHDQRTPSGRVRPWSKHDPHALRGREVAFVQAYVANPNGQAAAEIAGYPVASARGNARQLLLRARVRKAIREGQQQAAIVAGITTQRVLAEYAAVAFEDLSRETDAAMFKAKLHGKLRALNALGKHLGIGNDKLEEKVRAAVQDMLLRLVKPQLDDRDPALWPEFLSAVIGQQRSDSAPGMH